jgi:hypothetical protein
MTLPEFREFQKIARLNREVVVTEKIDGTNGLVWVGEDGTVSAGSRSRWITPEADNFGFAAWVAGHAEELRALGPGFHYGEWWGSGIQRGYGLQKGEKRFSLFNVSKWGDESVRPACCHVVPVLLRVPYGVDSAARVGLDQLREHGSFASPGFMKPEGIVIYHAHANQLFKVTLEKDAEHKYQAKSVEARS